MTSSPPPSTPGTIEVTPPPVRRRGPRGWWGRRRRRTKIALIALPLSVVLIAVGGAVAIYTLVQLPRPNQLSVPQSITIDYADGQLIAQTGEVDRQDIPLSQVPVKVREAVLAAEDRNFYHEAGVSVRGILRAAWADLRGGDISEGGSTITQQYVKNAYLTSQRTFVRKIKEIVLAVKLSRQQSKDEILDSYLNTIYFGRGAYGIEAAAHRYFGIPARRLSVWQGAVLAGLIRAPSILDPRIDISAAKERYTEVLSTMVEEHWLTPDQAAHAPFPATRPEAAAQPRPVSGPIYYIEQRVLGELAADGMSAREIQDGGFTVTTTLSATDQADAVTAVTSAPGGTVSQPPAGLREGLVAVDPATGAIKAYDAGSTPGQTDEVDLGASPPGSTYKAIVLAAAIESGISLSKVFYGGSPQVFPGNSTPISNDGGESYGDISLATATADSVNTVFVHLGLDVGEAKIAAMAHHLGLPQSDHIPQVEDQPLGQNPLVTPLTMAEVYSTFASGGMRNTPYLVAKVTDGAGTVILRHHSQARRVLPAAVADQVTSALEGVLEYGTAAGTPLADGRPAAGKTGTTENNVSAWFDGYTPQLVTTVQLYDYGPMGGGHDGFVPLVNIGGYSEVYGADIPAHVWQDFMDMALSGAPIVHFPTGVAPVAVSPSPSPSASRSPRPSRRPVPSPSPSVSATPTVSTHPTATPTRTPPTSPPPTSPSPTSISSPG